jgi:hypothetical protein
MVGLTTIRYDNGRAGCFGVIEAGSKQFPPKTRWLIPSAIGGRR